MFKNPAEYKLEQIRNILSDDNKDRISRLRYFVSSGDPYYKHKELLAAMRGIKTYPISSSEWKSNIHASKLVKRFKLGVKKS